jgi:hypothetical protein
VQIFFNRIESEDSSTPFLGGLGYSRDKDDYTINIRNVIENISITENSRLKGVDGVPADLSIELGTVVKNGDIIPALVNADSVDDIFVFTQHDNNNIQGILLLSNQE